MIVLALLFVVCVFIFAAIGSTLNLNSENTYRLIMWGSTFVLGSLLCYLGRIFN